MSTEQPRSRLLSRPTLLRSPPHAPGNKTLLQQRQLLLHRQILLLDALDISQGITQDLRFLERPRARAGRLLHASGRDSLFKCQELGVHVGAVPLLDDIVCGTLGSVPTLRILRGCSGSSGSGGIIGKTTSFAALVAARGVVFLGFDFGAGGPAGGG